MRFRTLQVLRAAVVAWTLALLLLNVAYSNTRTEGETRSSAAALHAAVAGNNEVPSSHGGAVQVDVGLTPC